MLRSGNGQHRRPRQAPAFVVTAGATGAGIALPLLTATGAHAATTSTWDRVAQCESGGLWSADNGDGFYGGLQLTLSTWQRYGGTAYAERPDLASRQEQIAVAEKVLEAEGTAAWEDCAVNTGLEQGGPAPAVDPGSPPPAPAASGATTGGLLSGVSGVSGVSGGAGAGASTTAGGTAVGATPSPGTASGGAKVNASASAAPAGPSSSAVPSVSPSAIPSLPAPSASSASSASSAASAAATTAASSGRHAKPLAAGVESPVGTQGDAVSTTAAAVSDGLRTALVDSATGGGSSYTVQPGDNLSQIATDHTASGDWSALYDANKATVGSDPNLIHPGEQLTLR